MADAAPGWYVPQGSALPRWWDGAAWQWESKDERIQLDEPTPAGVRARWFSGNEYDQPAQPTWYPTAEWEPPAIALVGEAQVPRWQLILPIREDGEFITLGSCEDVARPGVVLEEFVSTFLAWRHEKDDREVHDGIDESKIPLAWTPPPGWPDTPRGWSPPAGWQQPKAWPNPPHDWVFWRPDAEILNAREQAFAERHAARTRDILKTLPGALGELNRAEELSFWIYRTRSRVLAPLRTSVALGAILHSSHPLVLEYWQRSQECCLAAASLRTFVLQNLYGLDGGDHAPDVRLRLFRAVSRYSAVLGEISAALISVAGPALEAKARQIQRTVHPLERSDLLHAHAALIDALGREAFEWLDEVTTFRRMRLDVREYEEYLREDNDDAPSEAAAWERAEDLAAEYIRGRGYGDAARAPSGADGGFDVVGRGVVAQVKYLGSPVGRPDLQRLVGANLHAADMAFFSRSGYAQAAVTYAESAGVALFTIDVGSGDVGPVNARARDFGRR